MVHARSRWWLINEPQPESDWYYTAVWWWSTWKTNPRKDRSSFHWSTPLLWNNKRTANTVLFTRFFQHIRTWSKCMVRTQSTSKRSKLKHVSLEIMYSQCILHGCTININTFYHFTVTYWYVDIDKLFAGPSLLGPLCWASVDLLQQHYACIYGRHSLGEGIFGGGGGGGEFMAHNHPLVV